MSRQVFINYDLSNIFFPFFLDQFWQELVMTQCDTISRLSSEASTIPPVRSKLFIFLYMFDRKGGSSSIYSPCFETTFLHVDYHHMHLLPSKRTFRLFLATNNIYLLASQVTKDRLRVRKTKRKLNEILLKILYYNE